jgi:hypothetical protein
MIVREEFVIATVVVGDCVSVDGETWFDVVRVDHRSDLVWLWTTDHPDSCWLIARSDWLIWVQVQDDQPEPEPTLEDLVESVSADDAYDAWRDTQLIH